MPEVNWGIYKKCTSHLLLPQQAEYAKGTDA